MSAQGEGSEVPGMQKTYVLTDEEKKAISECQSEGFWYRGVPFSVLAMVTTQSLISKGILSTHTRFGSLPKVAFASYVGYLAGKLSYISVCKQRLMNLENSPLADALRQRENVSIKNPSKPAENNGSEFDEKMTPPSLRYSKPSFPVPEPPSTEYSSEYKSRAVDAPFSASMSESSTTGISDNIAHEPKYEVDVQPKSTPMTYEELRSKNRGAYEVLKPQTPARPIQNRTSKTEVKKNKYGDVWED